jgi:hypothetical protein
MVPNVGGARRHNQGSLVSKAHTLGAERHQAFGPPGSGGGAAIPALTLNLSWKESTWAGIAS